MTSQMDARIPQAALEERVHVLEERVSVIAEAVRVLAHGLEGSPTAEPGEKPIAKSARRAYELLLADAHPADGRGSAADGTP
jgi:hypothetical protein